MQGALFLHLLTTLVSLVFVITAILTRMRQYLIVVWASVFVLFCVWGYIILFLLAYINSIRGIHYDNFMDVYCVLWTSSLPLLYFINLLSFQTAYDGFWYAIHI
jgi:hypothetical protein